MHGLLCRQVNLRIGKRLALGDQDLALDEVDIRDNLGDRVLDLDPRVNLDEIEGPRVDVDQEFDRTGVFVPDVASEQNGRIADGFPDRRVEIVSGAISTIFWWRLWTEQSRS